MTDTAVTGIPSWWLVASGIFFVINILFFIVLTIAVIILTKMLVEMKPKIASLETSIQGILTKVNSIAEKVDDLTTTVKDTVAHLSLNAKSLGGNAELVAQVAGRQAGKISPIILGALTTMRVVKAIGDMRAQNKLEKEAKLAKTKAKSKLGTLVSVASHFLRK